MIVLHINKLKRPVPRPFRKEIPKSVLRLIHKNDFSSTFSLMGGKNNNASADQDESKLYKNLDVAMENFTKSRTDLLTSHARFTTAHISLQTKLEKLVSDYAPEKAESVDNAWKALSMRLEAANEKIDSLDKDDVSTDLIESDLNTKKKEMFIDYTKKVEGLISSKDIPDKDKEICSSLEYDRRLAMLDHIALTDTHKESVKEYMKAEEELPDDSSSSSGNSESAENRSLLDDFADVNAEQPSYMDPED